MRLTREFILGSRLTVLLPPMLLYDEYTLNLLMACHAIIVMCTSYSLHLGMGARISDLFFTEKQCHCQMPTPKLCSLGCVQDTELLRRSVAMSAVHDMAKGVLFRSLPLWSRRGAALTWKGSVHQHSSSGNPRGFSCSQRSFQV